MNDMAEIKYFDYKGYKCATIFANGFYCGYVFIDLNSKAGKKIQAIDYDDLDLEVHGGITFYDDNDESVIIGFDCFHGDDIVKYSQGSPEDKLRKLICFVIKELHGLVDQIIEMEN